MAAASGAGGGRDSLEFLALSLDSAGRPIPVVNTDPATELFLDGSATGRSAAALSERDVQLDVGPFIRRYPAGLFVDSLGPVVANDAYAAPKVWAEFRREPYHSPRVV